MKWTVPALLLLSLGAPTVSIAREPLPAARCDDRAYAKLLHRQLLDRVPAPDELEHTAQELAARSRRMIVHNRVLDSREFAQRVEQPAFVAGLYRQLRGRPPELHELLIGLHYLGEGLERSELYGHLLGRGELIESSALPALEGRVLDFRESRLRGYRRDAAVVTEPDPRGLAARLTAERLRLGGAEVGPHLPPAPSGGPEPVYQVFYGYLHAHTRFSLDAELQGSAGPLAAYGHARNVAGLDFLGLSDHAEFLSLWPWNNEWRKLKEAADAYTENGAFVALRGFEYSNPLYGHINVFGTPTFASAYAALTLPLFYGWLAVQPAAAATYNHPGNVDGVGLEFLHFAPSPAVFDQMVGIELLTHGNDYDTYSVGYSTADGRGHLDEALARGWRLASVSAQDNHAGGWGTLDEYRTGVLATELTPDAILEAIRARRFFSTQDRNLALSFRAQGREMGAVLGGAPTVVTVTLDDEDGEGFASIELVAGGSVLETRAIDGTGSWDFAVPATSAATYYYVVVTQDDGDRAMSAPLWVVSGG